MISKFEISGLPGGPHVQVPGVTFRGVYFIEKNGEGRPEDPKGKGMKLKFEQRLRRISNKNKVFCSIMAFSVKKQAFNSDISTPRKVSFGILWLYKCEPLGLLQTEHVCFVICVDVVFPFLHCLQACRFQKSSSLQIGVMNFLFCYCISLGSP